MINPLGIVKGFLGGPMVGELIKLDKEAQRKAADGVKWFLILAGAGVSFLGFVIGVVIAKLVF